RRACSSGGNSKLFCQHPGEQKSDSGQPRKPVPQKLQVIRRGAMAGGAVSGWFVVILLIRSSCVKKVIAPRACLLVFTSFPSIGRRRRRKFCSSSIKGSGKRPSEPSVADVSDVEKTLSFINRGLVFSFYSLGR